MNPGNAASLLIFLLPLLLLLVLIVSQRRRAKAMADFQNSITEGDQIVTTSGFYGRVVAVGTDGVVSLEVAPGVVTRIDRRAIGLRAAELNTPPASH